METGSGGNRKMALVLSWLKGERSRLAPQEPCPYHGESEGITQTGFVVGVSDKRTAVSLHSSSCIVSKRSELASGRPGRGSVSGLWYCILLSKMQKATGAICKEAWGK